MYHFISGYTAKVAGTEMGVTEPSATFSACFGAAFMVWHPGKYAELLAKKIQENNTKVWLVNTGWTGGAYGVGSRIKLKYTRAILDAIHTGELTKAPTITDDIFGLEIPTVCSNVPDALLIPQATWTNSSDYIHNAKKLATLFHKNFEVYKADCSDEIIHAGPVV